MAGMSKKMAAAVLSQNLYYPDPNGAGVITLPPTNEILKSVFEEALEAIGVGERKKSKIEAWLAEPIFMDTEPREVRLKLTPEVVKILLEAGVKNPVLEVAAKELGIEVKKSHAAQVGRK
jgi:hypothetical protein